ncbi:hypothetical protein SAMN05421670_2393 [Psychrobacillus psychrotolerans]|uniref:SbsC C-terminal domain-containing protein n=1 Tax=Psychrobacillus psychrotolerans TaxID=126156 RepID=A0A1I5Z4P1_9BACI|nr:hypothetical protein [Psychrobacillus psychrotolerans]SFQ51444.1 hypothetical protein SAMN05421670_2393 [Psychrobacillus psychrotolerans]
MKKNLLKQTTVAALLASTVLSFSPVAMGASSLDQSVNTVKSQLSKATTHYVNASLDGKLATSNELYPALNTLKNNYQSVRKSVVSSKLTSSQKQAKLKELDAVYNQKVSGGLVPYIDAYNYAIKYLAPIMKNIQVAQDRNDFATVEKEYHKLSYQLKGRTAILYRFSGKEARDLLLQSYKKPADAKRDELMVPVTIYMSLLEIKDFITAGKMTEAKAEYAEVEALLTRLPSAANNKFITALLDEVAKVKTALGETPDSAQQQILNGKVSEFVKILNTTQGSVATAAVTGTNSVTVTIVKTDATEADYVSYLGQGFYTQFVRELGVTAVNGHAPLSLEAAAYVESLKPKGVVTLADMKGKTLNIPVTVNNGSALNVNFSVTFK